MTDGRYLYCLVALGGGDGDGTGGADGGPRGGAGTAREGADAGRDAGPLADVTGVDGADPYLVAGGDGRVGAVVHPRGEPYESGDPETVRRWVLAHQSVVDAAMEAFGTPLPFRFGVVMAGDDDAVRSWIDDRRPTLAGHLGRLAGRREYRVGLLWDDGDAAAEALEADLRAADDRLAELAAERESASAGRSYLVGRQYDRRLAELKSEREATLADELAAAVESVAVEYEFQSPDGGLGAVEAGPDAFARLAVLARADEEDRLGAALDDVADRPGVAVRFTGPWPPYTFAPDLDGDGGGDAAAAGAAGDPHEEGAAPGGER